MIDRLVPQGSSYAGLIDWLFVVILITIGVWFLLALGVFFYFLVRFRRRPGVAAQYVTGTLKREKQWLSRPHALMILCDIALIVGTVYVWVVVKQDAPPADETVRIVAQQWAWTFVHPGPDAKLGTADDIAMLDELHVKEHTVYRFELTSRDVLHSFSVPVFRLKQDAVPGRVVTGWFKPILRGQFDIQCAEICGIGHALMPARLVVQTREEYERWMREQSG